MLSKFIGFGKWLPVDIWNRHLRSARALRRLSGTGRRKKEWKNFGRFN